MFILIGALLDLRSAGLADANFVSDARDQLRKMQEQEQRARAHANLANQQLDAARRMAFSQPAGMLVFAPLQSDSVKLTPSTVMLNTFQPTGSLYIE